MLVYKGMEIKFNREKIKEIAEQLLQKISEKDFSRAKVVALSGNLGAGKTTLTQELAKLLEIKENVISPTFIIMKIYFINKNSKFYSKFKRFIHIDAYRLLSGEELSKIGWEEIISNKDNLVILEWPENVRENLEKDTYWVKLGHIDEETRSIEF
jgi:tRNA threonylcarbamoyladenosine biosynthesis protein TsaE